MKLQFVREIPIRIVIQEASSARRGFLFYLAAGFSKDLNPLTGMTVNLVEVNEWLGVLQERLEKDVFQVSSHSSHALAEVMAVVRLFLIEKSESAGATLASLCFREERGWSFSWQSEDSPELMSFKYGHYLELFPKSSWEETPFDLLKVELTWRRLSGCEADFQHEGFKILKSLTARTSEDLHMQLRKVLGYKLPSGSYLDKIAVHYLAGRIAITL